MPSSKSAFHEFVDLLRRGDSLQAIMRFYDDEVVVFENRELARAGRSACASFEQEQLSHLQQPPQFRVRAHAHDEHSGHSFVELIVRFVGHDGRPQRLEQVAVQAWERGKIVQERFYYEGVVDEGDEPETAP